MKATHNQCLDKIIKCINSCITYHQWLSAWTIINNYCHKNNDTDAMSYLYYLHDAHFENNIRKTLN